MIIFHCHSRPQKSSSLSLCDTLAIGEENEQADFVPMPKCHVECSTLLWKITLDNKLFPLLLASVTIVVRK